MQSFSTLRRLHARGALSRGLTVDADGAMLGSDCLLIRRTDRGYRVVNPVETETILRYALGDREDFAELEPRLDRIARTLEAGDLAKAQILGLQLPFDELDDEELQRLELGTALVKAGYDPSQARDEDGRWTSGGNGGGITSGAKAPAFQPPLPALAPGAEVAGAAGSIWGTISRLAPEFLEGIVADLAAPLAAAGALFVPSNTSNIHSGDVPGVPGVSYRSDEGVLTIEHVDADGTARQLYFGFPDEGGAYQDNDGNVIGRRIGTNLILNTELIAAVANGTASISDGRSVVTDENQLSAATATDSDDKPEACPPPTPESIAGRSERALAYQEQITGLPRGFDVAFRDVRFDGCDPTTEDMLEAKGPGLAWALRIMPDWWIRTTWNAYAEFLGQAERQSRAAPDRIIEWHFADKTVADFFRIEFRKFPNIRVLETEAIVKRYLGWLQTMILMEGFEKRRLA